MVDRVYDLRKLGAQINLNDLIRLIISDEVSN